MRRLQQQYTVCHLLAHLHPLKRIITNEFENLSRECRLNLATNKKKVLVDFLSNTPAMGTKAATRDNI